MGVSRHCTLPYNFTWVIFTCNWNVVQVQSLLRLIECIVHFHHHRLVTSNGAQFSWYRHAGFCGLMGSDCTCSDIMVPPVTPLFFRIRLVHFHILLWFILVLFAFLFESFIDNLHQLFLPLWISLNSFIVSCLDWLELDKIVIFWQFYFETFFRVRRKSLQ